MINYLGMTLDNKDTVRLWTGRAKQWACLVIEAEDVHYEIRMGPDHVKAVHRHLPNVLATMDRCAVEDAACKQAEIAGKRAVDAAADALDQALAAEKAGAPELARALRAAAADLADKADVVDVAVQAFEDAAAEADRVTERLMADTREAKRLLARLQGPDKPVELLEA